MQPLSASIFRRGGPKKELYNEAGKQHASAARKGDDVEGEDADDEPESLVTAQELEEILTAPRCGREYSAAIWRPFLGAAELVKVRKGTATYNGFTWRRKQYLRIEEAVFFVDRGDLILFVENQGQQRLLSVQEAYDLMETSGVTMERYLVYSHLMRSGYLVMRHPSNWVLDSEQQPLAVSEAWTGRDSDDASMAGPAVPSEPGAERKGSAAATAMDVDAEQGCGDRAGSRQAAAVGPEGSRVQPASTSDAAQQQQQQQQQQGHRRWYPAIGSSHPYYGQVDNPFRATVEPSPASRLKQLRPRLRPLGPIPDGPHLGPPSRRSQLAFDVYKPGSKLTRTKGLFPPVMYRLAMCSGTPPTPQELREAEAHACAAGGSAPVMWVAVDNAIVTTFQIGRADLLPLV